MICWDTSTFNKWITWKLTVVSKQDINWCQKHEKCVFLLNETYWAKLIKLYRTHQDPLSVYLSACVLFHKDGILWLWGPWECATIFKTSMFITKASIFTEISKAIACFKRVLASLLCCKPLSPFHRHWPLMSCRDLVPESARESKFHIPAVLFHIEMNGTFARFLLLQFPHRASQFVLGIHEGAGCASSFPFLQLPLFQELLCFPVLSFLTVCSPLLLPRLLRLCNITLRQTVQTNKQTHPNSYIKSL